MRMTIGALVLGASLVVTVPAPVATSATARSADRVEQVEQRARTTDLATIRQQVVRLTNERRRNRGCRALRQVAPLNRAAQKHTELMATRNMLDHQLPGEPGLATRYRNEGYRPTWWGENIAAGQTSARQVVQAWMNSSGHRRNILNCHYRHIGVGFATSARGVNYWTQDFGTR